MPWFQKFNCLYYSAQALESDEQPITSESEDDHVPKKRSRKHDRRKHQRMWTLSEVTTLVDGISEYGVGRWTDIKRVLFSSSAYRTPIDLRVHCRSLTKGIVCSPFAQKMERASSSIRTTQRGRGP